MNVGKSIFLASVCFAVMSASVAHSEITVPPAETVANMSQAEWSKAWWQWAGSFEASDSPIADRTGVHCHLKQQGPVWFLAGTYGTARTARRCTIPRDKYVFFPLINYVVMPTSVQASCSSCCASFAATAKSITDHPSHLVLDLDGHRIESLARYRQATTECFDMAALADQRYRVFPSTANGYYVMLRPLTPGKHVLNFGGVLPRMSQAVTYTLIVE